MEEIIKECEQDIAVIQRKIKKLKPSYLCRRNTPTL